jgi:hypothetical protein
MNAPLPYALLQARERPHASQAPAAAPGEPVVQRLVWHSRYGTIEIEVVGQAVYVNGDVVRPAQTSE